MEEIAPGIWHWTARHPKIGIDVSSYFLAGPDVLLDPLTPPDGAERLEELGPPRAILLTNRHHYRHSGALAERFGCEVRASRPGMHEFEGGESVEPFDFGDQLEDGAIVAHEVDAICPDETALHIPPLSALAVADGIIRYGDELHFVPDHYMDDPERTKRGLRDAYRRLAETLDFDHLLLAHGTPLVGGAREALRAFSAQSP